MEQRRKPGPTPKPLEEKRINKLSIPLTDAERALLDQQAENAGVPTAEYARRLLLSIRKNQPSVVGQ